MSSNSALFSSLRVGELELKHRVVLAPLTRYRSTKKGHVPRDFVKTYYGQRGSTPGTLLITEATFIAPQAGGYDNVPGIWNDEQIAAWKKVH
jgi:NADPH2 dehydrogenase